MAIFLSFDSDFSSVEYVLLLEMDRDVAIRNGYKKRKRETIILWASIFRALKPLNILHGYLIEVHKSTCGMCAKKISKKINTSDTC